LLGERERQERGETIMYTQRGKALGLCRGVSGRLQKKNVKSHQEVNRRSIAKGAAKEGENKEGGSDVERKKGVAVKY